MKKKTCHFATLLLTICFLVIVLFPFYWQVITSLKNPADITLMPTELWPSRFSLNFYKYVFTEHHFEVYLFNSMVVGLGTMLISLMAAVPAAYAFSRVHFAFKRVWKAIILISSMFPLIAIVTPLFVQFKKWNLINTYWGLILPSTMITLPMAVWMLTAFLEKIPFELEEAANIDGASRVKIIVQIIMPLLGPGIFSTGIIAFITAWNELMFSLVMVTKDEMRTVPVGISLFSGQYTVPWGEISAASVVATIPIIALVLIFQKRITSGLFSGALKG